MKNKTKIVITISAVLFTVIIAVSLFIFDKNKNNIYDSEDVVLKENVVIITNDIEEKLQPYKIDDDCLYFKKNPKYEENDIIVSGITKAAPNGYIRKVVKIEKTDGEYAYITEPATFLDVFEELHVSKTFTLVQEEQVDVDLLSEKTNPIEFAFLNNSKDATSNFDKLKSSFVIKEVEGKDLGELFKIEFEGYLCEEIHIEGETSVKLWLRTKIDVEDGDIIWEMSVKDELNGEVLLGYSSSISDEYSQELFNAKLPNIQFMAGPVPIVITNEVTADIGVKGEFVGEIGSKIEINKSDETGFLYTSKNNEIEDITTRKFKDGGIWVLMSNFLPMQVLELV